VAAFGVAAMLVATGTAPLYDLVVALPGFSAAHNGRFAVVTVLCLAVLAGWGLEDLTASDLPSARRRWVAALAAALTALPLVVVALGADVGRDTIEPALRVAWGFQTPTPQLGESVAGGLASVVHLASLFKWIVLAGVALVLVLLRLRGGLGAPAFAGLAVTLVAIDLFLAGMGYNTAIPVEHAEQPATPAIRFLQDQRPARFTALKPEAKVSFSAPMPPNVSMRYGLYDTRGYVIPTEERYSSIWKRSIVANPRCYYIFCTTVAAPTQRAMRALSLFGVEYLLQSYGDPPLRLAGSKLAYDGPDARIYTNPAALPRAFLVGRQQVVGSGGEALDAVTAPTFSARDVAVTEDPVEGIPTGPGASSAGSAKIGDYEAERVTVETDASRPALLVLTDNWYPGWEASVDGKDVPIHRVDYLIRGVAVPAGAHRVEFAYRPVSFRAGRILSLSALLAILAVAGLGWRRSRSAT
jgi:hypothetical protein